MIRPNRGPVFASVFSLALAAAVGCAQPPPEAQGSATSKLLAPKPMLVVNASKATQNAVGISTWKLYRSKKTWILTGYDHTGRAVHGIELSFLAGTKAAPASLHGRWLDGSKLTIQHEYGGTWHSSGPISSPSKKLVDYARFDLRAAQAKFDGHSGSYYPPPPPPNGSTTPAPAPTGGATDPCGGDLTTILTSALACLTQAGNDAALKAQCIAAATSAASALQSCNGAGTATPPDGGAGPLCGGNAGDPNAGGPNAGDPNAGGPSAGAPNAGGPNAGDPNAGDPNAGDPNAGDPNAGDPNAGDPNAGADPNAGGACGCDDPANPACQDPCTQSNNPACDPNGGAGANANAGGTCGDQNGAGPAGGAAGGNSCLSCDPNAGDNIGANDGTGDVGYGGD